ncbi:MAG TPA: hypothetical protein PK989_14785 [Anaerolineales bacterium]|nr:hypothetical protein [Anaerolineales bacterium]
MPKPIKPSELEEMLADVSRVSEPDAEFLNSLRNRFIAEGQASAKMNQETRMRQKTFSPRLVWALVVLAIVAIMVLFTRPTVVTALKRLLGYVPNVGIIDQAANVRVLAEPFTVTRENVTVNVEQAVLDNEKIAIVYSYILPTGMSIDYGNAAYDERQPYLELPDGRQLSPVLGTQRSTQDCPQCSMRYMIQFEALSADVQEATLFLPSLVAVPLGYAPQDWALHLTFKTADPLSIAPIVEQVVTPVPTIGGVETPAQTVETYGITNTLDKVATLPNEYILFGNTAWTDTRINPYGVSALLTSIKDSNGTDIPFEFAAPGISPGAGELRVYWAYKIERTFTPPLRLSFEVVASLPVDGVSFIFDPGPNPQLGQTWDVNQDVTINGKVIHILTAVQDEPGYLTFTMQSTSGVVFASIADPAYPMMGGGGGGGGSPEEFVSGFGYPTSIPEGPLTLIFTKIELFVPGSWVLTWSP